MDVPPRGCSLSYIVFNQVETPVPYYSDINGMWPAQGYNLQSMIKDIEKSRLKQANKWSQKIQEEGVKCVTAIQRQRKYISLDILDVAKKNRSSLIAIASRSGPVAQTILGGVAQDVLLQAKCPVLIFYRPKAIHRLATKSKDNIEHMTDEKMLPQKEIPFQPEVHAGGAS